jgi:type III restriction enzyme
VAYYVDRVVVADAFSEPENHYEILAGGGSKLREGRRPSVRITGTVSGKSPAAAKADPQQALLEEPIWETDDNEFINELRGEVREWRHAGYPGTARVTRRLLEWWFERDDERHEMKRRFFFCQQEAAETLIYLYEVRRRHKMPATEDLLRYAFKLATGTGKTAVMAMIVVWSTLHKEKVSGSSLSQNVLVLVPNLTVLDRVSGATRGDGLDPGGANNLYDEFDMVPPEYTDAFRPNVLVRNWQSIPLQTSRDDWIEDSTFEEGRFIPASLIWAMQRRQRRDPNAGIKKILKGWNDCIVINDEAHHVYGAKRTKKGEDPQHIVWSKIIHRIDEVAKLSLVVDMTATPWYGSGAEKEEGKLFEWTVSDFSVYDAFESGLVKVVRLPEPGTEGGGYLDLWDSVKDAKTKADYLAGCRGAIASIYASWREDYMDWEAKFEEFRDAQPVLLVVADSAKRAGWIFEHLTTDYDLLRNPGEEPSEFVTIQVDSKTFEADRGKESVLREMMSTVGTKGAPGENVRCIVSVNMLSEGWDVKSVTHILGLRAFGSPLLTEQVVGRGLRKTDYSVLYEPIDERGEGSDETVDAFGVPFVGFPVQKSRGRKRTAKKGETPIPIRPVDRKKKYRIRIPNVRSWAVGVSAPLSEVIDVDSLDEVVVDPKITPDDVVVKPPVGSGQEREISLAGFREEHPVLAIVMAIAAELLERSSPDDAEVPGTGPTYEELLDVVRAYVDRRVRVEKGADRRDVWIPVYRQKILDILDTAIRGAGAPGMRAVPILDEPEYLDTAGIKEFKWVGERTEGKKTHLSKVACDRGFEVEFAEFVDDCLDVIRWVKNERLGFSVTYFENGRPRQYFPDFICVVDDGDGGERWVVAETKGELWPNTHLKRLAAERWCDQMTTAGQGRWSYLFVHQPVFNKATALGHTTLAALEAHIRGEPISFEPAILPVDDPRIEEQQFDTLLPLYSLEAAAGYFGSGEEVDLEGWVAVDGIGRLTASHFVARAVGKSMEPLIRDGDLCVFRARPAGTRQGKVLLIQHQGLSDPETGGAFTVKRYRSEKTLEEDGNIATTRIELRPDNPEFDPIVLRPEDGSEVSVIAEYVALLGRTD